MAERTDLRIADALLIPEGDLTGDVKIPTGSKGNYSVQVTDLATFVKQDKNLTDKDYVDTQNNGVKGQIDAHKDDDENPHNTTKLQIGLGNVDNTADLDKPVSNATQASIITAVQPKANSVDVYKKVDDRPATKVSTVSGKTQQEINDVVGADWYDKSGGYAFGDRVRLLNGDIVKNIKIDGKNTSNPNTDISGWVKDNSASQIFDENGNNQQFINSTIIARVGLPSELAALKLKIDDIVYIAEFEAYYKCETGTADNILSFNAGSNKIAKLIHNGTIQYKNIGSTASKLMFAVNNDLKIKEVIGGEYIADSIVQINRSDLSLEFEKLTYPTTISGGNNALAALIECKGTVTNENLDQYILASDLLEFSEYFPVSDITKFSVGDWIVVSNGTTPLKINYMCRVLELNVDRIKIDYRLGWTLSVGDTLNFKKVNPIQGIDIEFKEIDYQPTDTRQTARAVCLFQYASNCNLTASDKVRNTYWPVLAGRHSHRCSIQNTELQNPQETQGGGDGYLVQWQYSLYCRTENCITFAERHLNDFTMCAYSSVVNCRSFNSEDGGFVTHGNFEHDLYYENNVGLLSFANSGVIFGQRAKRITVNKHVGSRLIAKAGVVDLTLNDVDISDYAEINNDGFSSNNLTVLNGVTFTSFLPKLSRRKTLVVGGALTMNVNRALTNAASTGEIVFSKVNIDKFQNQVTGGYADIVFDVCNLSADYNSNVNFLNFKSLKLNGGVCENFGIRFTDARDQSLSIDGTKFTGKNSADTFIDNRKIGGNMSMQLYDLDSELTSGFHWSATQTAGVCEIDVAGGKYKAGSIRMTQTLANLAGSYLFIRGTTEASVARTLPTASAKVKLGDCLIF